jgi:hypothetical protein
MEPTAPLKPVVEHAEQSDDDLIEENNHHANNVCGAHSREEEAKLLRCQATIYSLSPSPLYIYPAL